MHAGRRIVHSEIPVRRVAVRTGRAVRESEMHRLTVEAVAEGAHLLVVAAAAIAGARVARGAGFRIHDHVVGMAVDAYRTFPVCLPGKAVCTLIFPPLEQDLVAGATHLRRIMVLGRCPALADLHDSVRAVAIAATRGSDQTRQQQRFAVFARQITVDQLGWIVVAPAASLYLVGRRNS